MNLKATLIGLLEWREKILVDTKASDALLFGTHEQLVDAYLETLKPSTEIYTANLDALAIGIHLNTYQRALACRELDGLKTNQLRLSDSTTPMPVITREFDPL